MFARDRADRRARPGAGEFRADLEPRLARWIVYGALEEILTGWVLGQLPDGDEDVARAERDGRRRRLRRARPRAGAREAEPGAAEPMWTLGLGAFGLAFSITTTAAYLPPLLNEFTDSGGLIGLVLGAEGLFALALSP